MESTPEPGGQQQARRRTFLIDKRFQLKWTLIVVTVGMLISATLGYFILRLSRENTELLGLDAMMQEKVSQYDTYTLYYLLGFVLVMALVLFIWGIFITHRVAGPIFIISRYLRQIADGKSPKTRPLRKGDELKEFFETFSAMLAHLNESNQKDIEQMGSLVEQLKAGDEKSISDATALLTNMLEEKKKAWPEN